MNVALVIDRFDPKIGIYDLWLAEISSGIFTRFTFASSSDIDPVWSPDGREIAFASNRKDANDIYIKKVGGGAETPLFAAEGAQIIHDWSKFLPDEWCPYVASFYGPQYPSIFVYSGDMRNHALDTGHYKEAVRDAFDLQILGARGAIIEHQDGAVSAGQELF